jgi:hypothetical protein
LRGTVPALLRIVLLLLTLVGCALREPPSPIKPAAPLPADPPVTLDTMQVECDGLLAALATYKSCKNLEHDDAEDIEGWIKVAERNLAAGAKVNPEPNAKKAIAGACHRAATSVKRASARCEAGPRPRRGTSLDR